MDRNIIGLVGPIASGKQILADYFKENGFSYISLSDEVRKETNRRGLAVIRANLQDVGNALRREFGNDILARRAMAVVDPEVNLLVIDSIRNFAEMEYLRKNLPIKIIGVDAPCELRLERYLARARERHEDMVSEEDFWKEDKRDRGENTASGQQVDLCLLESELLIENYYRKKEEFLEFIKQEFFGEGDQRERWQWQRRR